MTLTEAIDDLETTALQVKKERDRYRTTLLLILIEARERSDIKDGANRQLPNDWMKIAQIIEEVL